MEKKSKGEGSSTKPSSSKNICIREYAAAVRTNDRKKRCPINRSDGSETVFASLLNDALDDTPDCAKAQKITKHSSAAANLNMVINDVANCQEGPSQPLASLDLDSECPNEENFTTVAENDRMQKTLARRIKPQKYRLLSEIYEELGSCIYSGNDGNAHNEFATGTGICSDDITLGTFIRNKKRARTTSKKSDASKNKRKTLQVAEPSLDRAKKSKPVSNNSLGNDHSSDLGCRYNLRKIRSSIKLDLNKTDKPKKSSLETRNSSVTQKAKGVLKLGDGNQKRFTEEGNCSRPTHGAKSAQLVLPTNNCDSISNKNIETSMQDLSDDVEASMAAFQLLRLSNSGVNTKTSSYKTATEDRALGPKSPCGLNGVVQPSLGSKVCETQMEVNVINGAALPQTERTESGTYICRMSRNPAEFSIPKAKKFMRRV